MRLRELNCSSRSAVNRPIHICFYLSIRSAWRKPKNFYFQNAIINNQKKKNSNNQIISRHLHEKKMSRIICDELAQKKFLGKNRKYFVLDLTFCIEMNIKIGTNNHSYSNLHHSCNILFHCQSKCLFFSECS